MTVEQVRTVHSTVHSTVVIVDRQPHHDSHLTIHVFGRLQDFDVQCITVSIILYKYPDASPSLYNNHRPATERTVLSLRRGNDAHRIGGPIV